MKNSKAMVSYYFSTDFVYFCHLKGIFTIYENFVIFRL